MISVWGAREVGYLFGQYKKLTRDWSGVLTGKGLEFGGSLVRPEATGYGGLYFVREMLADKGIDIRGKRVAISGFGNVAWGAAQKGHTDGRQGGDYFRSRRIHL